MKTTLLLLLFLLAVVFSGCVGKRGISAKYYNDCDEYYDLQGYYHKKCDDEGMVTYKEMKETLKTKKKPETRNVY